MTASAVDLVRTGEIKIPDGFGVTFKAPPSDARRTPGRQPRDPSAHRAVITLSDVGCATIDFLKRAWTLGDVVVRKNGKSRYTGAGWRQRLVNHACAGLREIGKR